MGYVVSSPCRDAIRVKLNLIHANTQAADPARAWTLISETAGVTRATLFRIKSEHNPEPVRFEHIETLFRFLGMIDQLHSSVTEADPNSIDIDHAAEEDLVLIAASERWLFHKSFPEKHEQLRRWYRTNPDGFFVFRQKREIRGSLVLLPLRFHTGQDFLSGKIGEEKIEEEDIYPARNRATGLVYIESLVPPRMTDIERVRLLRQLHTHRDRLFAPLCGKPDAVMLCAHGVGGWSDIAEFGFTLASDADQRTDREPMYYCSITEYERQMPNICRLVS